MGNSLCFLSQMYIKMILIAEFDQSSLSLIHTSEKISWWTTGLIFQFIQANQLGEHV